MSLTAIILAAGKSTRMKSKRPKPLHEICGKPMLGWILEACYAAEVTRVLLVVGHGKDEIAAQFGSDKRIVFVEQTEQLGTGHAAKMCVPQLQGHPGDVILLAGDTPLISGQVLKTLRQSHKDERAAATMATAVLDDPTGYGRVVRDKEGQFEKIVEQIDCTPQEREIREVFPSLYCVKTDDLLLALSKLTNNNKKGEYYLTDIYAILRQAGKRVAAVQAATAEDILAPNTRQQLAEADAVMQERIQRQIREQGATIVSGVNTYVEANVSIGSDTVIHPFVFIGRDSSIGADCVIGPFASLPRSSLVPEGARIMGTIGSGI
ncbi:MAG: NTP transferase domain-containing protein [Tepidisphaeraceae bacterium]|jgi:bifunctional UDP-N-acetylglucosamine pyrophosphorylase/glucosamine-1-phosphate N-acetyltransferase